MVRLPKRPKRRDLIAAMADAQELLERVAAGWEFAPGWLRFLARRAATRLARLIDADRRGR